MLLVHYLYVVALTHFLILHKLLSTIEVNLRTVLHLLSRLYLASQEGTIGLAVSASRSLRRSTSFEIWRRKNLVTVSIIIIVVAVLVHDLKTRQELSLLFILSEVALHHLHLQLLLFFVKLQMWPVSELLHVLRVLHKFSWLRVLELLDGCLLILLEVSHRLAVAHGTASFAVLNTQHLLVMDEHLVRQTFNNPIMHKCFKRCHALRRVPREAAFDEVDE